MSESCVAVILLVPSLFLHQPLFLRHFPCPPRLRTIVQTFKHHCRLHTICQMTRRWIAPRSRSQACNADQEALLRACNVPIYHTDQQMYTPLSHLANVEFHLDLLTRPCIGGLIEPLQTNSYNRQLGARMQHLNPHGRSREHEWPARIAFSRRAFSFVLDRSFQPKQRTVAIQCVLEERRGRFHRRRAS